MTSETVSTTIADLVETEEHAVKILSESGIDAALASELELPVGVREAIGTAIQTAKALYPPTTNHPKSRITTEQVRHALKLLSNASTASIASPLVNTVIQFARLALSLSISHECQQDVPFAPMQIVRKLNGDMVWRCTHNPAHESPA